MTFLRPEEGGRNVPCFSGYRPQFFYDGIDSCAVHHYIGTEKVNPGDTVRAYLTFMFPEHHAGKIFTTMGFLIREGSRTIAKGRVLKILDLDQPLPS